MQNRVEAPYGFSGPLKDVLKRYPESEHKAIELKWYRAQMRSWAGHWRRRKEIAAITGIRVEEIAKTDLSLAKIYRDNFHKLKATYG